MNENIKAFSLVVITLCVFVMTVIDILELVDRKKTGADSFSSVPAATKTHVHGADEDANVNQLKTKIRFDEEKFDFGTLTEGDVVNHTFNFTNTGSHPLIISEAIGSCGCTVPTYPKEPIQPGGQGTIEVQFNSAGKKDIQDKTVSITANTDPQVTVLSIHALVEAKK